jgi:hypothetical protein
MAQAFPGDYLKVHNRSDRELKLTWDGRSVKIGPGKVGLATFEQVVNHLGHPAAGGAEQKMEDETGNFHIVPTRDDERKRVSIKQGWDLGSPHAGGLQTLVAPPDVAVYTQDDERVWTVVEDPEGEHQMPVSAGQPFNQGDQIERLRRQLTLLEKQVAGGDSADLSIPGVSATRRDGELPDLDVPTDDG